MFFRKVNRIWGWYEDGDEDNDFKYVGEIKNGEPNGLGTETFYAGTKYVGEYKDGKRNGQGTITWSGGKKYVGEWKNGTR